MQKFALRYLGENTTQFPYARDSGRKLPLQRNRRFNVSMSMIWERQLVIQYRRSDETAAREAKEDLTILELPAVASVSTAINMSGHFMIFDIIYICD